MWEASFSSSETTFLSVLVRSCRLDLYTTSVLSLVLSEADESAEEKSG